MDIHAEVPGTSVVGKIRGIDDGKRGRQNLGTKLTEAIPTMATDWLAQGAGCVIGAWEKDGRSNPALGPLDGAVPADLSPALSTDDVRTHTESAQFEQPTELHALLHVGSHIS